MSDVLITENIQGAAVDALHAQLDVLQLPNLWKESASLAERVANCRALIVRNQTQVTARLLAAAPELLVVGRAGVGLDNIDLEYAKKAGIVVSYTPDQNAISVAELTIGMMLSLARSIPALNHETKGGHWSRRHFGTEVYGKTLGIVGAGKIGFLTARRALAFGMKVLAYDPFVSRDSVLLSEVQADLVDLDTLLSHSDVVSVHLPATPETSGLLNSKCFRKMKPSAFFINTSRGKVVCEPDLLEALKSKAIAGAALDVRAVEPPKVGELETLPNVILMPHVGAFTREAQDRVTRAVCEDVARVLDGKPALNPVNGSLPNRPVSK
jgi:D-3-phosphoglycerate dehydrogenase / 2-oxoglutarate reductase